MFPVLCPIVNDSNIATTASTAELTISGYSNSYSGECGNYDGTGGIPAIYACAAYTSGGGGCTLYSSETNSGLSYGEVFTASFTSRPGAWGSPAEYYDAYYMEITLGCAGSGGYSEVSTYTLYN
jgi:hypothetical protein